MAAPEPDRGCLLVDTDGDVWRYEENAWLCLTESAYGAWGYLSTQHFGPFQVFAPQSGGGVGASPAATAEHRTPSAQADQDERPPTPPPLPSCCSCGGPAAHVPCCSSHNEPMCCKCYRRFHFVEVGPCCLAWRMTHPEAGDGDAGGDPSPSPRMFELYRHRDISGVSGTGTVAWGTQWPDKTASLRWTGPYPAFANWPDIESMLAVHGHEGATELVWLDVQP